MIGGQHFLAVFILFQVQCFLFFFNILVEEETQLYVQEMLVERGLILFLNRIHLQTRQGISHRIILFSKNPF